MINKRYRTIHRLTALDLEPDRLQRAFRQGKHRLSDGGDLYLRLGPSCCWAFIYRLRNKQHEVRIGRAGKGGLSLAEARRAVVTYRAQINSARERLQRRAAINTHDKAALDDAAFLRALTPAQLAQASLRVFARNGLFGRR